jgi:hypothetical protein
MLSAFRTSLPLHVSSSLNSTPSRYLNASNIESTTKAGRSLWKRIHHPTHTKVECTLKTAHLDLPVFIIENVYGGLFTDPNYGTGTRVGRIATSLFAIACLRAQQGVGTQLLGHVRGLRKAWEDDSWRLEPHAGTEDTIRWLISDEGCTWVLTTTDRLVRALGEGHGNILAPIRAMI